MICNPILDAIAEQERLKLQEQLTDDFQSWAAVKDRQIMSGEVSSCGVSFTDKDDYRDPYSHQRQGQYPPIEMRRVIHNKLPLYTIDGHAHEDVLARLKGK